MLFWMRSKTYMSEINLQRGILTVENRSREKKRICSEVWRCLLILYDTETKLGLHYSSCCGLVAEHVARQIRNKSTTSRPTSCATNRLRQPGFHLPRHTWSLVNRFRTGQGPCRANLHKWGLAQSPSCDCGQRQTMNHIVDTCPLTKLEGGLNRLHKADGEAVTWLESTATAALAR